MQTQKGLQREWEHSEDERHRKRYDTLSLTFLYSLFTVRSFKLPACCRLKDYPPDLV
jgi:hypothetical protein